jgi:hypothetical protein
MNGAAHDLMKTVQYRSHKIAPALAVLIASSLLSPRLTIAQSGGKCTLFGTPKVSPALVRLENSATPSAYKRGKPIHVTLTLQAGVEGVYLPDFFGAFQETCSHGFATEILTLQGRAANPNEPGCAYAGPTPKIRYIELKPGEVRAWSADLSTASIVPGHYCLYAEYLSFEQLSGWAVNLPDDKALVAKGRITTTPIPIEIR